MLNGRVIAVDSETTGLNPWQGDLPFAWSFANEHEETAYIEFDVDPMTRRPIMDAATRDRLRAFLKNKEIVKSFFNAKFDLRMAQMAGLLTERRVKRAAENREIEEVSFMARSCFSLEPTYKLNPLAKKYLKIDTDDETELHDLTVKARRIAKKLGWQRGPAVQSDYWMPRMIAKYHPDMWSTAEEANRAYNVCKRYAVRDAMRTIKLRGFFNYGMNRCGVVPVYEREMDLWPITYEMESKGIVLDEGALQNLTQQCRQEVNRAKKIIDDCAGEGFNPNSPPQLSRLLFGWDMKTKRFMSNVKDPCLGLKPKSWTDKGNPKCDADTLVVHKSDPVVDAVLRYKANRKALSDFFEKFSRLSVDEGGESVIHCDMHQWGTMTRRYSMSDPPLQCISNPETSNSRGAEYMVNARAAFRPRRGCVWYLPDYSQIEVIIFADTVGEETMLATIRDGKEKVHTAVANQVWGGKDNPVAVRAAKEVIGVDSDREARDRLSECGWRITDLEEMHGKKVWYKRAKGITFNKIFGGGVPGAMSFTGLSENEAKKTIRDFDKAMPNLTRRMNELINRASRDGYIYNVWGQRLKVDRNRDYAIINWVVQSTAAGLIKEGMIKCYHYLRELDLDAWLLLQAHDELVFEFRKEHSYKKVLKGLIDRMSDNGGVFSVPTPVEIEKASTRWSDKQGVSL